jgi:hypothetical protein
MVVNHGDGTVLVHEGRIYRVMADHVDERVRSDGDGCAWEQVRSVALERQLRDLIERARRT